VASPQAFIHSLAIEAEDVLDIGSVPLSFGWWPCRTWRSYLTRGWQQKMLEVNIPGTILYVSEALRQTMKSGLNVLFFPKLSMFCSMFFSIVFHALLHVLPQGFPRFSTSFRRRSVIRGQAWKWNFKVGGGRPVRSPAGCPVILSGDPVRGFLENPLLKKSWYSQVGTPPFVEHCPLPHLIYLMTRG